MQLMLHKIRESDFATSQFHSSTTHLICKGKIQFLLNTPLIVVIDQVQAQAQRERLHYKNTGNLKISNTMTQADMNSDNITNLLNNGRQSISNKNPLL